jgi:hypothetical protein
LPSASLLAEKEEVFKIKAKAEVKAKVKAKVKGSRV